MNIKYIQRIFLAVVPLFFAGLVPAMADVRLPHLFSSNMVLQQGIPVPVWGWANPGEHIHVEIAGKMVKTTAGADGKWLCKLPAMDYGGPFRLLVQGQNRIELENVMIGEVWICGGQSNMGLQMQTVKNAEQEIAGADLPDIRLFSVTQTLAQFPKDDVEQAHWAVCSPATVRKFSGVGYFFGRELFKKLKVPVGLISSNVGGTMIERWASPENMLNDPDFKMQTEKLRALDLEKEKADRVKEITRLNGDLPAKDAGLVAGLAVYAQPGFDTRQWMDIQVPSAWNPLFVGVGWSITKFTLKEEDTRQEIELHLSRIDDDDITYLNGKQVGSTVSVGDRTYRVAPEFLQAGENALAVRIVNRSGTGGLCGKPEEMYVKTASGKISLQGTWKFRLSEFPAHGLDMQKNDYPTILYNGMINPLIPFGIRGVIWYQGEANIDRTRQYQRLFPNLITDWRKHWQQGDFPFIYVSLANYQQPADPSGNSWAFLREAQAMALKLPNTAMASAIDVGEGNNLHPINKQDVGYRLMLCALRVAYHQDVLLSPVFKSATITGDQVKITFDETGNGLVMKDGSKWISGFTIAGQDKVFRPAKAELIDGRTVRVFAEDIAQPAAVRYAWANDPGPLNLYNSDGLPAHPFRTDNWDK